MADNEKQDTPKLPVWNIPKVKADGDQSTSSKEELPSYILVADGTNNPIICSDCPCKEEEACYFVFESICTEDEWGEAVWSTPTLLRRECLLSPPAEGEWLGGDTAGQAIIYIKATRDTIPDNYNNTPWPSTGIASSEPVYCEVAPDICGILEYTRSAAYQKEGLEPPSFDKCCQANGAKVDLFELPYDTDQGFRYYHELTVEQAIVVATFSNDNWHFTDVKITGEVRGCLVARVIYPDYCEQNGVNYIDYPIADDGNVLPYKIEKETIENKEYNPTVYGHIDTDVIPVPALCTLQILLFADNESFGIAVATTDFNRDNISTDMSRRAYIGCNLIIEWCPYSYYGFVEEKCKEGALTNFPSACLTAVPSISFMKANGSKIHTGHPMFSAESSLIYSCDDTTVLPLGTYCLIANGYSILTTSSWSKGAAFGNCVTSVDMSKIGSFIAKHMSGQLIVKSGEVIYSAVKDWYVNKSKINNPKVGCDANRCTYFELHIKDYRPALVGGGKALYYLLLPSTKVEDGIPMSKKELASLIPKGNTDLDEDTELGTGSDGYVMSRLSTCTTCGCGTFSTLIEGWTNNAVSAKHEYSFMEEKGYSGSGVWESKCFLACPTATVLLKDIGPKGNNGRCPYREGKYHESRGEGECPKEEEETSYCTHISYGEPSVSECGQLLNVPDGRFFETAYCYDGFMRLYAYCPEEGPPKEE